MNRKVTFALACLGLLCAAATASAATFVWTGKGQAANANLWTASQNWEGGGNNFPGPTDTAVFDVVAVKNSSTPTIGTAQGVRGIAFAGATSFSIEGTQPASTLTIGSGGIANGSGTDQNFRVNVALATSESFNTTAGSTTTFIAGKQLRLDANTLTVDGVGAVDINSSITGSGSIVKHGAGTLTLGGNNSSFTGSITVNNGFLQANTATALGASSDISLLGGSTASGTLSFSTTPMTVNASSTPITLAGGTLNQGGATITFGTLTMEASSTIQLGNVAGSSITFTGQPVYNNGLLTVNNWNAPSFVGGQTTASGATSAIFITAQPGGGFLANVQFDGYPQGAAWLSGNNELVPVPEPQAYAAVFGLGLLAFAIARRRLLKTA